MSMVRDDLALVMLAAWLNVSVEKLPEQYRAHTCEETMKAWARVAQAARAHLQDGAA